MKINWIHFPLHPETPAEGQRIEDLFAGRNIDMEAMYNRMKALMDAEDLPYARRSHTYNSRLAQELAKWADAQPGGEAIHDVLFAAYFVEGLNLADVEVLVTLADRVGLSSEQARQVVTERLYKEAVDEDWAKSRQFGITGVPTFVAGGYGVVGAQSYETLTRLVEQALA